MTQRALSADTTTRRKPLNANADWVRYPRQGLGLFSIILAFPSAFILDVISLFMLVIAGADTHTLPGLNNVALVVGANVCVVAAYVGLGSHRWVLPARLVCAATLLLVGGGCATIHELFIPPQRGFLGDGMVEPISLWIPSVSVMVLATTSVLAYPASRGAMVRHGSP